MITLKTLPQSTAQEVFDQVAKHMLEQYEKCEDISGVCKYMNARGLKCAAGSLIGADEYSEKFEGMNWTEMQEREFAPEMHGKLIEELQAIHDSEIPEYWRTALKSLAITHHLSEKVLDNYLH